MLFKFKQTRTTKKNKPPDNHLLVLQKRWGLTLASKSCPAPPSPSSPSTSIAVDDDAAAAEEDSSRSAGTSSASWAKIWSIAGCKPRLDVALSAPGGDQPTGFG